MRAPRNRCVRLLLALPLVVSCAGCGKEPTPTLMLRGMQKSAAGDHAGALDLLDRAVAQSPNDATVLVVRGGLHDSLGDPAAAVADYERAIALAPELEPGLAAQIEHLRARAGGAVAARPSVPETGPRISHVTFCAAPPRGYRDYEVQPDARYRPGDTVWIYLDVQRLRTRADDAGGIESDFRQRLRLTDPTGRILIDEFVLDDVATTPERVYLQNRIDVPRHAPAGEYRVDLLVEDQLAGVAGIADARFVIEHATASAQGP